MTSEGSGSDRRDSDRVPVAISGNLRHHLEPSFSNVMMANLSMGGAFLRTAFPLARGELVRLQFSVPEGDHVVEVTGEVVWIREDEDLTGMGIRFLEISPEDLRLLRGYLDEVS